MWKLTVTVTNESEFTKGVMIDNKIVYMLPNISMAVSIIENAGAYIQGEVSYSIVKVEGDKK